MCGIAGIVSLEDKPVALEEVQQMCSVLTHRGPDEDGFYFNTGVCLGMRRLSIIDLKTGRQPIRNEDGSIWVVFNGEIYNFKELFRELIDRGHTFLTATDTEVIVHLYEEYGLSCVDKMRGMFAFAVWDGRRKELFVARDRLGIKPLYYAEVAGRMVFASEVKVIHQLPEIAAQLNWGAVSHPFTLLFTASSLNNVQGRRNTMSGNSI